MLRIVISCFVFSFILGTSFIYHSTPSHAENSAFTVKGVKIDITSENAVESREKAFSQGQRSAFRLLSKRLLDAEQIETFEMPENAFIDTLVKDFEITNEKVSTVRYIGTYTFRFKEQETSDYFKGYGVGYTDVQSRPVLVLPFYSVGPRTVLWGPTNPWMKSWSNYRSSTDSLVPTVVPRGDIEDVRDIGDNNALNYNGQDLMAIADRYGAGESVIMLALPQWTSVPSNPNYKAQSEPDSLTIMFYRTDLGAPDLVTQIPVNVSDKKGNETIYDAGVRLSIDALQNDWKKRTTVTSGADNILLVRVQYNDLGQWVDTQTVLKTVQGIRDFKLISVSPKHANIELYYSGTESRLRLALAQSDVTLTSPQLSFNGYNNQNNYGMPYNPYEQSPLIYDLYLNRYYRR